MLACLRRGAPVHGLEVRLRHKDGSQRCVLVDASVVSHEGTFLHARCFSRETHEELDGEQFRLAVEAARTA